MNQPVNPLPSDWMKIAKKDWVRIHHMLEYDDVEASGLFLQQSLEKYPPLGASNLTSEDIKRDLSEAIRFVKAMFPNEKLRG